LRWEASEVRKLKALQNPFLLVAEGFVAGAILFFATTPGVSHALLMKAPPAVSAIAQR
jgi:hypothetical protein